MPKVRVLFPKKQAKKRTFPTTTSCRLRVSRQCSLRGNLQRQLRSTTGKLTFHLSYRFSQRCPRFSAITTCLNHLWARISTARRPVGLSDTPNGLLSYLSHRTKFSSAKLFSWVSTSRSQGKSQPAASLNCTG